MTFQQLQYLIEVYRTGSVTQAAKQLFVSASSVSISVSNLEKGLGYPIFVRNQKGLALTDKGKQVLEHANRICESHKQLTSIDQASCTHLRIASLDYAPCSRAFTRLIEENQGRHDISFSLLSGSASPVINKVANFEIDIGIITSFEPRILALEANLKRKGLQWRILEKIPCAVTIGTEHECYTKDNVTPADLKNDLLVDSSNRTISDNNYLKGVISIPQDRILTVDNTETRYQLIGKGLAYSIGRMLRDDRMDQYGLRSVPLQGINYQMICITNSMRILSPEAKRFLEMLDEEIQK